MEATHRSNAKASPTGLNKKVALAEFRAKTKVKGTERIEAWRLYVEELFKAGRISAKQRETWHLPS